MDIKITENKKISINVVNARELSLDLNTCSPTVEREEYEEFGHIFKTDIITKLDFYGEFQIKLGDVFTINKVKYTVNKIVATDEGYLLIEEELTKSSQFLLPSIALPNTHADINYRFSTYFYNAYLYTDKYNNPDNKYLFLCYKFYNIQDYKELETFLTQHKNYVKTIEVSPVFTIFVFETLPQHKNAIKLIMDGEYHSISSSYKRKLISFYKLTGSTTNTIHKAIYRPQRARENLENELGITLPFTISLISKPIKEIETFNNPNTKDEKM